MSSAYRPICLSHDPAIVMDTDWQDPLTLEGALARPERCEALTAHVHCDLLGGRYSYPLIEVYCPTRPGHVGHWIDVEWLHLLHAAYSAAPDDALTAALAQPKVGRCWTRERINRLSVELGITRT